MTITDKEMEVLIREYTRFNINIAEDVETVTYIKNLLKKLLEEANAERESLLAQNAMMRETLEFISHDVHYDANNPTSTTSIIYNYQQIAKQALSAKPRLVEVGEVDDSGDGYLKVYVDNADKFLIGTKLYTIQKGE